jgi:hypothetical protein
MRGRRKQWSLQPSERLPERSTAGAGCSLAAQELVAPRSEDDRFKTYLKIAVPFSSSWLSQSFPSLLLIAVTPP